MSSKSANRRKPRRIGGDDEDSDSGEQDSGPVVKRPTNLKAKQKSKLRLSFGPGETSMTDHSGDGENESEVVMPKRHGLGRRALEKSAFQRSLAPSGTGIPPYLRVGPEQDRPSYSQDYLKQLRESTPSTPKATSTEEEKEKIIDVAAKFGEVIKASAPTAIPSEAEISEKKARRARLAKENGSLSTTEKDFISLNVDGDDDEWDLQGGREQPEDTRLIRDDEDFAEGFDEFVEDGRISLGRKAEREQQRRQREEMRELIDDAEALSGEDDSDLEEKAAYEAKQTRAAMGQSHRGSTDRPRTPPKVTSLPRLAHSLERLRMNLAILEKSKARMIDRMEELRKEKADIAVREVEIQVLIKEAGDTYEKLKQEAEASSGVDGAIFDVLLALSNMSSPPFVSWSHQPSRKTERAEEETSQCHRSVIPFIESPIDEKYGDPPHLYHHSDATAIELFFDLFFVANLSTFTATHEINNVEALGAYVGFLGVVWFTWLQVTLFDIRFARDSIFERICKAIQLAVMVGFASAGTRFTTRVREENVWAFQSLSLILGVSRLLLSIQYTVNAVFLSKRMRSAAKRVYFIVATLFITGFIYLWMYFAFRSPGVSGTYAWIVWFVLFVIEMWVVMGASSARAGIGLQDTHLNVRMGLLTLIILGEGVIAITRIVNKTVGPGGWTKWSFAHILGVTTSVYFLWQVYFDLSPQRPMGKFAQQIWGQLHFPFHVVLILLLEGSQILALTLDITLKLKYLTETILWTCEEPRPRAEEAIRLLQTTIADMEINYGRGAVNEQISISRILDDLSYQPLCPSDGPDEFPVTSDLLSNLVGNVTAALFSSMGIMPSKNAHIGSMGSDRLLRMYMELLSFVYVYYFVVATLAMFLFAAFVLLTRRHARGVCAAISVAVRVCFGIFLAGSISFSRHFSLVYSFMTSPAILYAFTLILLTVLLVDRFLDRHGQRINPKWGWKHSFGALW
ncbi:uncharacterized protein BP01DRAFT_421403 [Aspergillus saccharolyticus JOP 1030-1]|uniref:Nineteen complex-related protein 2-domain-containing protein n=1 Tax=Aspergillus saccharolyticus JOP 1030-1 TaxID=1450539 RepID=A0A318ZJH8_9EURO|nr:hypothetical protein BP01DRAFT_421403 [Aspergillus saccharolyticus JOP 1030-1]PYH47666.1 hypothetical protein BP01DRAFT_421403 [Aspergillus saccharolyticus JOP 1030-1]